MEQEGKTTLIWTPLEGKKTLGAIMWDLMLTLTRLEAMAELGARCMREQGLEDEASMLLDLRAVAGDWMDEIMTWVANLVRKLLQPGEAVRADPRQDGWAYYCADRCERPAGAALRSSQGGRPSQTQAPTPTPNRPTENRELVSLKDLVEVERAKLQALSVLAQGIGDVHAYLHELQKALEGQTAMLIVLGDALKELVQAVKSLYPSSQ